MPIPKCTPEEFVGAWQAAESTEEVANALGMDANAVRQRAWNYRNKGVRLKRFAHPQNSVDVGLINGLISVHERLNSEEP